MGQRSIFFRNLERKKLAFPIFICMITIVNLNTNIGHYIVRKTRENLITFTSSLHSDFQNISSKIVSLRYFFSHNINKSILDLHKENLKLAYEIENLKHLKEENEKLRELLSLKNERLNGNSEMKIAKITSAFSNDYVKSCILNLGAKEGVEVGDVVRNLDGFVGIIAEVQDSWSCLLLITDTNSKIPVKIGDQQINAIISGDNSDLLSISMKNEDASVKEGDLVESACLEGEYCNKIPVGKIIEKDGMFFIKPFVKFGEMKYLCILKNK